MTRWLVASLLLAACYLTGSWLAAHPGEVQVTWFGYEVVLHIAVLGVLLILVMAVVSFFAILLWRMLTWPSRRRARRRYRTFRRGLEHLTRGVAALSMGNEALAEEAIKKAMLALPGEPLPQLLTAQLLQRQGKQADAQVQFKALLTHKSTTELATRRLIEQHISRSEWQQAITLIEEARKTTPRDRWLVLTLIDLYAREKKSTPMLALTEGWQWQSPLSKDERNRMSALGYYLAAQGETNVHLKERDLRHAVGYAPDFLPAIIDYAYVLLAENSERRARKWLLSAWESTHSPLLIAPILDALKPASPRMQARLLRSFLRGEQTAIHHLLHARHAIAVGNAATARTELEASLALEETKEAALLMADLERKLRNDEASHHWLSRAANAPAPASWICMHCGTEHSAWQAHCNHCHSFDTLRFERPQMRISNAELAPLAQAN